MKYLVCLSIIFTVNTLWAQEEKEGWKPILKADTHMVTGGEALLMDAKTDSAPKVKTPVKPGSKETIVSPLILTENEKYSEYSKQHPQIKGYTILLYSGSGANSRLKAREMAKKFEAKFEGVTTHVTWKSPNYEVRIGDYRTKVDAQIDLELITSEFPTAFIKTGMIELPSLEKEELKHLDSNKN